MTLAVQAPTDAQLVFIWKLCAGRQQSCRSGGHRTVWGFRMTVAALFVQKGGVYWGLDDVDPWDESRDARLYAGPWPVVAHPPCNRWAKLGPRSRRGQDGGCFASALASVRRYGGVIEHPAESGAWRAHGLARPTAWWRQTLTDDGWVVTTDQSLYGFPTRKPTWLYFRGPVLPPELSRERVTARRGCESLWSTQRSHTPPEFRDVLLGMARSCHHGTLTNAERSSPEPAPGVAGVDPARQPGGDA